MARKPGFYARQFRQAETRDLQAADERGLSDEIAMLRVAMRRTIELADGVSELPEMVQVLKALAIASGRLADLLRAQEQVDRSQRSEVADLLAQELAALAADYKLAERFTSAVIASAAKQSPRPDETAPLRLPQKPLAATSEASEAVIASAAKQSPRPDETAPLPLPQKPLAATSEASEAVIASAAKQSPRPDETAPLPLPQKPLAATSEASEAVIASAAKQSPRPDETAPLPLPQKPLAATSEAGDASR
jgi:hypothetical protein